MYHLSSLCDNLSFLCRVFSCFYKSHGAAVPCRYNAIFFCSIVSISIKATNCCILMLLAKTIEFRVLTKPPELWNLQHWPLRLGTRKHPAWPWDLCNHVSNTSGSLSWYLQRDCNVGDSLQADLFPPSSRQTHWSCLPNIAWVSQSLAATAQCRVQFFSSHDGLMYRLGSKWRKFEKRTGQSCFISKHITSTSWEWCSKL